MSARPRPQAEDRDHGNLTPLAHGLPIRPVVEVLPLDLAELKTLPQKASEAKKLFGEAGGDGSRRIQESRGRIFWGWRR